VAGEGRRDAEKKIVGGRRRRPQQNLPCPNRFAVVLGGGGDKQVGILLKAR